MNARLFEVGEQTVQNLKGRLLHGVVVLGEDGACLIKDHWEGIVPLGQQMQDVTIQAQLGTNAFQIFAQQAPQAAFALSGLANSANKTKEYGSKK